MAIRAPAAWEIATRPAGRSRWRLSYSRHGEKGTRDPTTPGAPKPSPGPLARSCQCARTGN